MKKKKQTDFHDAGAVSLVSAKRALEARRGSVGVAAMSREAVELQLVNYYAREGYYHHLQVRKQCTYFPRLRARRCSPSNDDDRLTQLCSCAF